MVTAVIGCSDDTPSPGPEGATPTGGAPEGTTRSAPRVDADLAYAALSPAQRLDLYRPSGDAAPGTRLPVIVAIHGGGFAVGDKLDMARTARTLVARGYAVASLNYRMSGEAPFPAAVADVKAGVRWLRVNADRFGLDPRAFGAIGESAGAYLAAMLGVTGNQLFPEDVALGSTGVPGGVGAVVDLFGPVDFASMDGQLRANPRCSARDATHDRADSPESRFLGRQITTAPELVRQANPLSYLGDGRALPPFLIEHGDADCTVPFQQSQQLADGLRAVRASVELTILPGVGHGYEFPVAERLPAIAEFFDRVLR